MPKNRNQAERYQTINHLLNLRKGSVVHISEFIERCNAPDRTIKRDIQNLRERYDAPIEYDIKREGYFYSLPFDIPLDLTLSHNDITRLKVAVETLEQLQHLDIFKDLRGSFQKIQQSVQFKINTPSVSKVIYFEPVPFYRGTEHISIFLKAIEATRSIRFKYQSFKSPITIEHEINPYFLQEFGNRWYAVGFSKKYERVTSFALERIIEEPEILKGYFDASAKQLPTQFFKNTFGMTHDYDAPVEEVVFKFKALQAKYFKSKPFHEYKIIEETGEYLVVSMKLKINYELVRKLLSMSNEVQILKPNSLIEVIKEHLKNNLSQYE